MSLNSQRQLARMLGYKLTDNPDESELREIAIENVGHLASELVIEALANDDVTSALAASEFIAERLNEWDQLLPKETQQIISAAAQSEIMIRVPGE